MWGRQGPGRRHGRLGGGGATPPPASSDGKEQQPRLEQPRCCSLRVNKASQWEVLLHPRREAPARHEGHVPSLLALLVTTFRAASEKLPSLRPLGGKHPGWVLCRPSLGRREPDSFRPRASLELFWSRETQDGMHRHPVRGPRTSCAALGGLLTPGPAADQIGGGGAWSWSSGAPPQASRRKQHSCLSHGPRPRPLLELRSHPPHAAASPRPRPPPKHAPLLR